MSVTITSLEKSVNVLAKNLIRKGFSVIEVDVFKDGTRHGEYGGSYVELTVAIDGIETSKKFLANGYSDFLTWAEMKKDYIKRLKIEH